MEKLNLFTENSEVQNKGIIEQIEQTKTGEPLSKEGPALFLYDYITYENENIILENDNNYYFHNINNEDEFDELDFTEYGWNYSSSDSQVTLSLVIESKISNPFPYAINFTVNNNDSESLKMFKQIIENKSVTIQFLSILYGQIYNYKNITFEIDDNTISKVLK